MTLKIQKFHHKPLSKIAAFIGQLFTSPSCNQGLLAAIVLLVYAFGVIMPGNIPFARAACDISVGVGPHYITKVGSKVYTHNSTDISVIDTTSDTVTATIPIGSGPLFSTVVGSKIYVNDNNFDIVHVIDTSSDTVVTTISVGTSPNSSFAVGTKLYVNNPGSNNVSVVNTLSDTVIATIAVGSIPRSSNALGTKLYVLNNSSNDVSVIDTTSDSVVATLPVGAHPVSSNVIGTKIYVTNDIDNTVSVIDSTSDSVVATIPVGTSPWFATVVGTKLYVNNYVGNSVSVIDSSSDTVVATIPVGTEPRFSTAVGSKVYVSSHFDDTVSVIDTSLDSVVATINLPVGAGAYYSTLVGSKLYFANGGTSTVSVIDTTTDALLSACGYDPSPATPTPSGGGLPWNTIRQQNAPPPPPPPPPPATLSLSVFQDLNRNKTKDLKETGESFIGLPVTIHGLTADSTELNETAVLDSSGNATLSLAPSSSSGYTITIDTGSSLLAGFKPTTPTVINAITLASAETRTVSFGFRPKNLLSYRPCLTIESRRSSEERSRIDATRSSDAETLLSALYDVWSLPVLRGISTTNPLISRNDFLTLLQRTQCIPLDGAPLQDDAFIDLEPTAPSAPVLAALLSRGFPLSRSTPRGPAADIGAPLTRREALLLIASALHPPMATGSGITLPTDLTPENALSPVFLALRDLNVLPSGFQKALFPERGLTLKEASTLLIRASFASGKIPVTDPAWEEEPLHSAASTPAFLGLLPTLPAHSCLKQSPDRASTIRFSDLLPGDPLYLTINRLLTLGITNTEDKTLWLLPATRHLSERGVTAADIPLNPDAPVSLEETIRSLLIVSCLPFDTAAEVRAGVSPALAGGTLQSRASRDRLTDLPRNPTLASRILYKAQDHTKAYDLSLFTYAQDLLSDTARKPQSSFSAADASSLFSSALLGIAIRDQLITPQSAEVLAPTLRNSILASLLGQDSLNSRDPNPGTTVPLTRRMLMSFLAQITANEMQTTNDIPVPLGKLWWERIK